jgi:hypothetical protein
MMRDGIRRLRGRFFFGFFLGEVKNDRLPRGNKEAYRFVQRVKNSIIEVKN